MATVMVRSFQNFFARTLWVFFFLILFQVPGAWADVTAYLQKGDKAVLEKDFRTAENYFTQALSEDPQNYRIILSLARVKAEMKKLEEADQLLDRILAMKVSNGRNVLVFMQGQKEPLEAEIVDET
ncbi:MAG: tetratricopeptide repeat protein, partial [Nitrospinales bacterium]